MISRRHILWIGVAVVLATAGIVAVGLLWDRGPRHQGRSAMEWARDLNSQDPVVRRDAAQAVLALGTNGVPAWMSAATTGDPAYRQRYIDLAPRLAPIVRRFVRRVADPLKPEADRIAGANALALLGTNTPVEALILLLQQPDTRVSGMALNLLMKTGPGSVPHLTPLLAAPEGHLRSSVCYIFGTMGGGAVEAAPALVRVLKDPDTNVVRQASTTLLRMGRAGLPALLAGLGSSDPELQSRCLLIIGGMGLIARSAAPDLVTVIMTGSREVRDPAVDALGRVLMITADSLRAMAPAYASADPGIREGIERALSAASGRATAGLPVLTSALDDPDPHVRAIAARILGLLGPKGAPAAAALASRLRDEEESVREEARRALQAIDPDRAASGSDVLPKP